MEKIWKIFAPGGLALCILAACPLMPAAVHARTDSANLEVYRQEALERGAIRFPVIAQVYYREAIKSLQSKDEEEAEILLRKSLQLDPYFPDAYFTLARIYGRKFDIDAILYLFKAFEVLKHEFSYQSLLVSNLYIYAFIILLALSTIASLGIAIKYLPFSAHKIKEFMERRFNSAFSGVIAYMVLFIPFVVFPGIITGFATIIILTWVYLEKKEKAAIAALVGLLAVFCFSGAKLAWISVASNPKSLTFQLARANNSPGYYSLIRSMERAEAPARELESAKNTMLGVLHLRNENFHTAVDYLLKAIAVDPRNSIAYINLGNVYYLQGNYQKALEGYRKAESIDSLNAICQYNLAQAYIKTLLMGKSSVALNKASMLGIEEVKSGYSREALKRMQVSPATFESKELWKLAVLEGNGSGENHLLSSFVPLLHFKAKVGALILILSLLLGMILRKIIHPSALTFQCSNCGRLTCSSCCNDDRGFILCQQCAASIDDVSSEKVIDALLRQNRQSMVVRRRKSARLMTIWIPGLKNMYYGRFFTGCLLAGIFTIALIELRTKGFILENPLSLQLEVPRWKFLLSLSGLILSYLLSVLAKHGHSIKTQAAKGMKLQTKEKIKVKTAVS